MDVAEKVLWQNCRFYKLQRFIIKCVIIITAIFWRALHNFVQVLIISEFFQKLQFMFNSNNKFIWKIENWPRSRHVIDTYYFRGTKEL